MKSLFHVTGTKYTDVSSEAKTERKRLVEVRKAWLREGKLITIADQCFRSNEECKSCEFHSCVNSHINRS